MIDDLDTRLRAIVIRHTVIGGHPDTMAIARDAYALARSDIAKHGVMQMERSAWRDGRPVDERCDIEAWLETAPAEDVRILLDEGLDAIQPDAQRELARIWSEAARVGGRADDGDADGVYHWKHRDRIALRRTLSRLRPNLVEMDAAQGAMF